jgi:hypothetical protein
VLLERKGPEVSGQRRDGPWGRARRSRAETGGEVLDGDGVVAGPVWRCGGDSPSPRAARMRRGGEAEGSELAATAGRAGGELT